MPRGPARRPTPAPAPARADRRPPGSPAGRRHPPARHRRRACADRSRPPEARRRASCGTIADSMRVDSVLPGRLPVFSFEFFPPRSDEGARELFETIAQLRELEPTFVSVTYGAGG